MFKVFNTRHSSPFLHSQSERNTETGSDNEGEDEGERENGGGESSEEDDDRQALGRAGEKDKDEKEKLWDTLTGAKANAEMKQFQDRHWAATEIFYSHLATATARLEAKRDHERG